MSLNCQSCDAQLKKERGCTGKGTLPFYIDNEARFRCPIRLVSGMSWDYIRAYDLYKKNFLPNGKGWLDESDKFLNAMTVIDNEIAKMENSKMKRKKPVRGNRGKRP